MTRWRWLQEGHLIGLTVLRKDSDATDAPFDNGIVSPFTR